MCQKFKLLMSHAHLIRGRNLVALATTSSKATAAATSAARAVVAADSTSGGDDDDVISGDGNDSDASQRNQVIALQHFVHSAKFVCLLFFLFTKIVFTILN